MPLTTRQLSDQYACITDLRTSRIRWKILGWLLPFMLAACASSDPSARREQTAKLTDKAGWQRLVLDAPPFQLAAFVPRTLEKAETLTIYIEGDGHAWINAHTPSSDPTPIDPLALKLALRDTRNQAVYLARPCQFVKSEEQRHCDRRYWTSHRFAPEVVSASNLAIDQLKARFGASTIRLVGYSGGGAIAALVAARRSDVSQLVTVAGNLDHAAWTSMHRVSPLSGSLNPVDSVNALQSIPQVHFSGEKDRIISTEIAHTYTERFAPPKPSVIVIPDFNHHCCWEQRWPALIWQIDQKN